MTIRHEHNGIDFDDLAYTALRGVLIVLSATVSIGVMLWVMASPDRPIGCEAYRGAEVAACVEEAR